MGCLVKDGYRRLVFYNINIGPTPPETMFNNTFMVIHKTVKTNDKIRRFGVVMTPLSRKIKMRSCKLQHLRRFWREKLT